MQFHLNGFKAGDPALLDAVGLDRKDDLSLPAKADVLIVGCGPAGLTLAAQLSAFPDICTVIVEQKPGPLRLGQADGIACRTMEMFEAFGFAHQVLNEAYRVNETTFWKPDDSRGGDRNRIVRSGRVPDVEEGLSHMPHVILNQARVHDFFLEKMLKSGARLVPHYSRHLANLKREDDGSSPFKVTAHFERQDEGFKGVLETIRARYVVGCDGARSVVRSAMGLSLKGDSANHAWGVMDVLVNTDFPDIRFKTLIQSASEGSILVIPREGGYLVRIYVEMDKLSENERVAGRNITLEQLIAAAQRIFHPYKLDVKEVPWWSVYEIGQRLADRFDDLEPDHQTTNSPHIFIAGDACHTHSPKAGQGMNVSMQDGFNIGWKLAAVLQGRSRAKLLNTYSAERQAVAQELINFDRKWAAMLSGGAAENPDAVQRYFVQHGRYTAGTATHYEAGLLTGAATHQHLATGFVVGTRFHSAPVVRIGDARHMQLGKILQADGRWRILAFGGTGDAAVSNSPIAKLCKFLSESPDSPVMRHTPPTFDVDSVIDIRAILQKDHQHLDLTDLPELIFPPKGRYMLRDYEKAFCASSNATQNIYALRGISVELGCMVVVRPDQYIAQVLPLNDTLTLTQFFESFMVSA